jgi:hypothetical protein
MACIGECLADLAGGVLVAVCGGHSWPDQRRERDGLPELAGELDVAGEGGQGAAGDRGVDVVQIIGQARIAAAVQDGAQHGGQPSPVGRILTFC